MNKKSHIRKKLRKISLRITQIWLTIFIKDNVPSQKMNWKSAGDFFLRLWNMILPFLYPVFYCASILLLAFGLTYCFQYLRQFLQYLSMWAMILFAMWCIRSMVSSKDPKVQAQVLGFSILLMLTIAVQKNKLILSEPQKEEPVI